MAAPYFADYVDRFFNQIERYQKMQAEAESKMPAYWEASLELQRKSFELHAARDARDKELDAIRKETAELEHTYATERLEMLRRRESQRDSVASNDGKTPA